MFNRYPLQSGLPVSIMHLDQQFATLHCLAWAEVLPLSRESQPKATWKVMNQSCQGRERERRSPNPERSMDKKHDCVILSSPKIENCPLQRKSVHPYFRQINGNPGNSPNAKAPDPTSESEGAVAKLGKPFLATLYRSGRPAPQQQSRLVRVWRQQVLLHIIWCTSLGNTTIGSNRDGNSSKAETGDCSRTSRKPKKWAMTGHSPTSPYEAKFIIWMWVKMEDLGDHRC